MSDFTEKDAKEFLDALHDAKKWEALYKQKRTNETKNETEETKETKNKIEGVRMNLIKNLKSYYKKFLEKRQPSKTKSSLEKELDSFEIFSNLGHTDNIESPSRSSPSRSSPSRESHHRQYTEEEIEEALNYLREAFEDEEEDKHKSKKRKTSNKKRKTSKKGGKRKNKSQKNK